MAITKSFGGVSIKKPGAYSKSKVDLSGGAPLAANGTIMIVGEASSGERGSVEGIQAYTSEQLSALIEKYVSGPIVDVARAAILPSKTPGVQGASGILVWKTNGATGGSTSSDFSDGFEASLSEDLNVIVPAISRDAADDIADNLTDAASSYDIASVHAALDSHLRLRGSIKNRKEAQGIVGRRDLLIADTATAAATLASELIQMAVQDCLVLGTDATLQWKQPHVTAGLMAGIRLGTEVGEPLTHKFLNCNGVGHAVDAVTGLPAGDFRPATDFDTAIDAGLLFAEKAQGGFRIVVDNTTYGADQSFVFNRGSVVEAAQYIAKTLRETAELVFVGRKVSNGIAQSIKSVLRGKLLELNAAQITTASDDAPLGFVEETFVVSVQGNTANVQIEVKPVQGLDFIFIDFTLGDITQSA